jgi:GntR family transcriptional regulator
MNGRPVHSRAMCSTLLKEMRTGAYAQCPHLPPETELSLTLGISRTQLRDTLAILEQEGFITRRHGVGTVINRHVLDVPVRMDIETEFLDMIKDSGFESAVAYVRAVGDVADGDVAKSLDLAPGAPVFRITRLCTADGRPAIYCEDVVDRALVHEGYTLADLEEPIFNFLEKFCGIYAYMDLTDLQPVAADETLARIFGVSVGTPLLKMREVDYDVSGKPVFHSIQYFADGIFRHTVLRKKL